MRKVLFGIIITLLILWVYQLYKRYDERSEYLRESTALIQQEIKNVRKLVVTEGHFSQVFNYKQSEKIFANLLTTEKKALVVVNADVTIAYDLSKITFDVDEANKTLYITGIPEPEIKISPDLKYYDISSDYLNPFNANDFNKIKAQVNQAVSKKINESGLKENAENRLISELSRFYVLTNSLGWKLVYNKQTITDGNTLETLNFN
ncbi:MULTISPECIES: DUF4230 domain-containing protein [Galbibacter]|uniref:DUF4230 domain-containing protein n=1 Tax=Galbibacter pacificus TaxID=2996052 RepID=A0ABT6FVY2_9FLAO|nr:DUF4230 domain-containing protein [Galbibacter pacificus]MDG3584139.1 DUF4230 domain-containing protein [Galbibacter pacificus]MDG3587428.1 DUF4230 domain-containing protein [Galbibacter pacificus]